MQARTNKKLNYQQASLMEVDRNDIIKKLHEGRILRILHQFEDGRDQHVYLVELDNDLLGVFKSRQNSGRKGRENEVMCYHMAVHLFGLPYTVPPTIEKRYQSIDGVLQYYVATNTDLNENLHTVINHLAEMSYADLQVLRFVACIQDTNVSGLIAWEDSAKKFHLTTVDNEEIHPTYDKYGETIFGPTDLTNYQYPSDAFISKYTSVFNPITMEKIQTITRKEITDLYLNNGYKIDDSYLNRFLTNRDNVVKAYRASFSLDEDKIAGNNFLNRI